MKKLLLIIANILIIPPVAMYSYYTFSPAKQAQDNPPTITTHSSPRVLGATDDQDQIYFTVNIPATFKQDISAPNVVYSVNGESGEINIDSSLVAGSGITIDGREITNSGILTLTAGDGITVDGNKITNSGIISLSAGTNISIDGNKINNTYSVDLTASGWTDSGTAVTLTTTTDTVTVGTLTTGAITASSLTVDGLSVLSGNATIGNGVAVLPSVDLGSDLGSSSFRFNNLWVANINSNSSQAFSGQTTFSYPPTDTTISEASVIINPTTSAASGQLLGLAIAGYQKALIDEDGDIILGYSDATSAPASDYPLNIYGHSGTRVAFVDTSGNATFNGSLTANAATFGPGAISGTFYRSGGTYGGIQVRHISNYGTYFYGNNNYETLLQMFDIDNDPVVSVPKLGIGTTSPGTLLHIATASGTDGATAPTLRIDSTTTSQSWTANSIIGAIDFRLSADGSGPATTVSRAKIAAIVEDTLGGDTGLSFSTSNDATNLLTEYMRITSSGNLGIGTTSPGAKLDIYQDSPTSNQTLFQIGTSDDANRFSIDEDGDIYIQRIINGNSAYLDLNNGGQEWTELSSYLGLNFRTDLYGSGVGDFRFTTHHASYGGLLDLMIIKNSGQVGIGTTTPASLLDITGGLTTVGSVVTLGTKETTVDAADVLGRINFYAPLEADGTDAILLGASIVAMAEASFSTTVNTTALHFQTGTSEAATTKMTILGSGNVGIGTTGPNDLLHLAASNPNIRLESSLSTGNLSNVSFYGQNSEASTIEYGKISANVDVNTAGSEEISLKIQGMVGGALTTFADFNNSGGKYTHFYGGTTFGSWIGWGGGTSLLQAASAGITSRAAGGTGTETFRYYNNTALSANSGTQNFFKLEPTINQSGTAGYNGLLMNVTETAVGSGAQYLIDAQVGGTTKFNIANDGTVTTTLGTGTVYSNSGVFTNTDPSDETLKDNILTLEDGTLDKLLGLRPVSFDWKSTGDGALGFIAQEVDQIFPELVGSNSDGTLGLYTTQFIPVLAKAIQEQQMQIDGLGVASESATITEVEGKVGVLEGLIAEIRGWVEELQNKWEALADNLTTKKVNTEEINTKELCVGETEDKTCLNQDQVDQLMELLPSPTPDPSNTPEPSASPTPSPSPEPSLDPEASESAQLD